MQLRLQHTIGQSLPTLAIVPKFELCTLFLNLGLYLGCSVRCRVGVGDASPAGNKCSLLCGDHLTSLGRPIQEPSGSSLHTQHFLSGIEHLNQKLLAFLKSPIQKKKKNTFKALHKVHCAVRFRLVYALR